MQMMLRYKKQIPCWIKSWCALVLFFFSLVAIARSRCAMVEKWWWPKYWLVSIGNIIGYARSCCKFCHDFFPCISIHCGRFTYIFCLIWIPHSEKKLFSERWKLVQQFPQLVYYLQITSYLFLQRRWRRFAVVGFFFVIRQRFVVLLCVRLEIAEMNCSLENPSLFDANEFQVNEARKKTATTTSILRTIN